MAVLSAVVIFVGEVLYDRAFTIGFGTALAVVFLCGVVPLVFGLVTAFIATQVAAFLGVRISFVRAYSWIVHSSMVAFVGLLAMLVPVLGPMLTLFAVIGSHYVAWEGIAPMISIPTEKRLTFFIAICFAEVFLYFGLVRMAVLMLSVVSGMNV
jgi:hypothetical protein